MWFLYVLGHTSLLALVNYLDEYLTHNNKVPENSNIHRRIGGLLLISLLLSFVGALVIYIAASSVAVPAQPLFLAVFSAVPMAVMYGAYFYLLTSYPVYQVVPLFQISSIWLLGLELLAGGSITLTGLVGVFVLMAGAYFLDAGTLKWRIPTQLLFITIPVTAAWAIALFLVRFASETASPIAVTFWQLIGTTVIGLGAFVIVKKYRDGFLYRIQNQGKNFLGFSLINESLAQGSYFFANLAVAAAPVAAYVTATSGIHSVTLLLLFLLFPLAGKKTKITSLQMAAIILIAVGVFLIQGI